MLRGVGQQATAAAITGVGLYVVGLPVSFLLAYVAGWGLAGLWWGLVVGDTVLVVLHVIAFRRIPWSRKDEEEEEEEESAADYGGKEALDVHNIE